MREQLALNLSEAHRMRFLADDILVACREYCDDKYKVVAAELDEVFGPGHPVSKSTLYNALNDTERNYARLEWAPFFAQRIKRVAVTIAAARGCDLIIKPKTAEQRLARLEQLVREKLGPTGEELVREALR